MCSQVRRRKTLTLSTSQVKKIYSQLGELRGALEKMFDISLPVPSFTKGGEFLPSIKKFCSGLLEKGTYHLWRDAIRGLSSCDRVTVAGSLFLFRKVLPTPDPSVEEYIERMSTPGVPADPAFLSFVRREMRKMFRPGWDRYYVDEVLRTLPSTSSCVEGGRDVGGCRGLSSSGMWFDRFEAVEAMLTLDRSPLLCASRVCVVDTGGKKRIISIPSADMNLLRPLHSTIYNHLSRFPWLLRGDAKPSRFADFTVCDGEVFVSGDYESATDNLNQEVQRCILDCLLETSSIPEGIRELATSTLSMFLKDTYGGIVRQQRGQLMGNLLSFPLLCIVNFLAFKYSVPRNVPLRINGDDIVFRALPEEVDRWKKQVGRSGLTLSLGKTMVDARFFSLNSCWFRALKTRVLLVPVVRSTALFGKGVEGLRGRFKTFSCFGKRKKEILQSVFLRRNSAAIHSTNRSVTRGLGMSTSLEVLVRSRMWARESFYLSMGKELPLPPPVTDLSWQVRVPGWKRTYGSMTKEDRSSQKEYMGEAVDLMWSTPPVIGSCLGTSYRDAVKEGTFAFSTWLCEYKNKARKWSRLMGLRLRDLRILFKPRRSLFRTSVTTRKVWYFTRDVATRRNIKFVAKRER